jgi:tetratricopeptide (TPR) repeat protein
MKFLDKAKKKMQQTSFNRGIEYYKQQMWDRAAQEFVKTLNLGFHAEAQYHLGYCQLRMGFARPDMRDFIELGLDSLWNFVDKDDAPWHLKRDAFFNMGKAYEKKSDFKAARRCYEDAAAIDPKFSNALCDLGMVQIKIGESSASPEEFEKALTNLDKALSLNPDDYIAYYNKGRALEKLSRDGEAIQAYERFLSLAPPNLPHRQNVQAILLKLKGKTT